MRRPRLRIVNIAATSGDTTTVQLIRESACGAGAELTLGDLASFLGAHGVAKQKIHERLEIVPELPTTQSGKVQKFRLREIIRATLEREQQLGVR